MDLQTAYQQPQGMGPDGMSGFQSGLELLARRQAQQHQLEQMGVKTQQDQANLQRYQGMTPGMVQVQNLDGARAQTQNTPEMLQAHAAGQRGQWQQQQAQGQHDVATVGGKIDQTQSSNLVKSLESTARSLELAATAGTLGAQEGYDQWRKGISPAMQQYFPAQYTPDVPNKIREISRWLEQTPQHRQQMERDQLGHDKDINVTSMNNTAAAHRSAQANASAESRARITADRQGTAENRDRAIARLQRERRANPSDENVTRELTYYLNSAFVDDFAKDARGMMMALNPAMGREHESYQQWSRAKYFDQHGIENPLGSLAFEEYKWVQAAMQANHGATIEQVLAEGRKRGRIKSRPRK